MSKFADSPYFLLKDYMKAIVAPPNPEYLSSDIQSIDNGSLTSLYTDVVWVGGVTNIVTGSPYKNSLARFPAFDELTDTASIFTHDSIRWGESVDRRSSSMYHLDGSDGVGVLMRGMETSIIVDGGQYINLWAKVDNKGYVPVRLNPLYEDPIDKRLFRFNVVEVQTLNYDGACIAYDSDEPTDEPYFDSDTVSIQTYNYTYTNAFADGDVLEPGTEIYIRKDSNFHNWLRTESMAKAFYQDEFEVDFITRNYVNTDKLFLYFGKIYNSPKDSPGDPNRYQIEFYGLKDWINRALPPNNRKELFVEFLDTYFDMVYHEGYSQLKDVWSLRDAMECNETFLAYIPTFYNVRRYDDIPSWFAEIYREYARDVVWLLKRKGTYASLHIIKDLFCRNTSNIFTVMERWHVDGAGAGEIDCDPNATAKLYTDYVYTGLYGKTINGSVYRRTPFTDTIDYTKYTLVDGLYENVPTTTDKWGKGASVNVVVSSGGVTNAYLSSERGTGYQVGDILYVDMSVIGGYEGVGTVSTQITEVDTGGATQYWYNKTFSTYPSEYQYSLGHESVFVSDFVAMGSAYWSNTQDLSFHSGTEYTTIVPNDGIQYLEPPSGGEGSNSSNFSNKRPTHVSVEFTGPLNGFAIDDVYVLCGRLVDITSPVSGEKYPLLADYRYDIGRMWFYFDGSSEGTITNIEFFIEEEQILSPRLSPFYRVDLDLTVEPLTGNSIMPKQIAENLYQNWEMMRPINRQAEYNFIYSPYTDLSGTEYSMYDFPHTTQSVTKSLDNITFDSNNYIYTHGELEETWIVNHNLLTTDVIVTAYTVNLAKQVPDKIQVLDDTRVLIEWSEPMIGVIIISRAGTSLSTYDPVSWRIRHGLNRKEMIFQVRTHDGIVYHPDNAHVFDRNTLYIEGAMESDSEVFVKQALTVGDEYDSDGDGIDDSIMTQDIWIFDSVDLDNSLSPKEVTKYTYQGVEWYAWVIDHPYNANMFQVNCYDTNNRYMEPSRILNNELDGNGDPALVVLWGRVDITSNPNDYLGFAAIDNVGDIVSFYGVIPKNAEGGLLPVQWRLTIETDDEIYTFLTEDSNDSSKLFSGKTQEIKYFDWSDRGNKTYVYGDVGLREQDDDWYYYTFIVTNEALVQLGIRDYKIIGIEIVNTSIRRAGKQRIVYSRLSGIFKPLGVNFVGHFRIWKDPDGFGDILLDHVEPPIVVDNSWITYTRCNNTPLLDHLGDPLIDGTGDVMYGG